ncbi:hypothetical protein ETD86_40165 [Nonomuraea turkmeniaca]|uniref:NAD(P)-binding domain-containing protein n=1 Tax=Nonomuraea turkmeniaca TaxID=103838 RepID=A0A5S4F327_9ACTN|nr:hypothetical protein ETD86_40165 [Nonomuraea turkmeniaca]
MQIASPPDLVEVVEGDLTRPKTVAPALDGVKLVFLFPVPETVAEIVDLAAAAGVRRIVALSCGSAGHGDGHHLAVERAVAASRLEWTCLRPYGLMSNALLWAPDVRAASVVRAPHGRFCYPHVHPADVAAVAVSGRHLHHLRPRGAHPGRAGTTDRGGDRPAPQIPGAERPRDPRAMGIMGMVGRGYRS